MKPKLFLLTLAALLIPVYLLLKPGKPLPASAKVDRILVEKGKRKLHLLFRGEVVKTYRISLGRNPVGDKQCEGDRRTPEGVYRINGKNPHSGYHKNLGISYPDRRDVEEARLAHQKPGGDIKIHGLKNGRGWIGRLHLLRDWTFGCIALTNREVDEIYAVVTIGTPVEIRP